MLVYCKKLIKFLETEDGEPHAVTDCDV